MAAYRKLPEQGGVLDKTGVLPNKDLTDRGVPIAVITVISGLT